MSAQLHHVVVRSHSAATFVKFLTGDFAGTQDNAREFASDVTVFDTGTSGVDLFFYTMGSYALADGGEDA